MTTLPEEWCPLPIEALRSELEGFEDWVLCGGYSIALLTGKDTRIHDDIDIGVFRSHLKACLGALGTERVFLCKCGTHIPWDGGDIPEDVHDIWVTDRASEFWVLQIMVFDDEADRVFYRRDRRINWLKRDHFIEIGGTRVLNPFVTLLFKVNRPVLEEKDAHDIMQLIARGAVLFDPPTLQTFDTP